MKEPLHSLDQISTRWQTLNDPLQFVMRYAPAIHKYLCALIKNAHDADEVSQEFLLRVQQHGFANVNPERGRFRDYLKKAIRNAGLNHLQRAHPREHVSSDLLRFTPDDDARQTDDQEWVAHWRECLLTRAWRALNNHQQRTGGNLFYTVLRLVVAHPQENSDALAARASELVGRPLRPAAFRKQFSRGRRLFAKLLVAEVAQTLEDPTPVRLEEELTEVGLLKYLRAFLPADWSTRQVIQLAQ